MNKKSLCLVIFAAYAPIFTVQNVQYNSDHYKMKKADGMFKILDNNQQDITNNLSLEWLSLFKDALSVSSVIDPQSNTHYNMSNYILDKNSDNGEQLLDKASRVPINASAALMKDARRYDMAKDFYDEMYRASQRIQLTTPRACAVAGVIATIGGIIGYMIKDRMSGKTEEKKHKFKASGYGVQAQYEYQ